MSISMATWTSTISRRSNTTSAPCCSIPCLTPYVPASVHLGADGTLYLYSPQQNRIHRWSFPTRRTLGTDPNRHGIALCRRIRGTTTASTSPIRTAGSPASTRAFPVEETAFATLPASPLGLTTAGPFVVAVDPTGAWESHHVFGPTGTKITAVEWNHPSRDFAWSPANRRLYYFRDSSTPNDLMWETIEATGQITTRGESPYHGDYAIAPPIRVSRDGARVLLGSGDLYDGTSLQVVDSLPFEPAEGLWLDGA